MTQQSQRISTGAADPFVLPELSDRQWIGFFAGLAATSIALSSGFIWAYQGLTGRVFLAAFVAWVGYLCAHRASTGRFVDPATSDGTLPDGGDGDGGDGDGDTEIRDASENVIPETRWRQIGVVLGVATLVAGMVVGVFYIRAENHLLTNVGGILFLGGYVIAHYAETNALL
ncbi:hypothetical protein RH858_15370 [Halalkaliarchaeum sp. AArc-GB]|uniref:hypothetical protein n=1 Tax=Halalkaliarchaeum sp. AArc-GB TaxID=3074078 RepID=UPI00285DEFA2|nr:hypothetical protein [Halalkaliarchaeum sp. AArc-GB]MDR5674506.1 hypothetical protein [Halalkaliarchaeum sp. AArc-GB]